jgi:hypothetical protein
MAKQSPKKPTIKSTKKKVAAPKTTPKNCSKTCDKNKVSTCNKSQTESKGSLLSRVLGKVKGFFRLG